jgi:hypothetical protein
LALSLQWRCLLAHAALLCCGICCQCCRRHRIAISGLLPPALGRRSRHVGSAEAKCHHHLLLLLLQALALAGAGGALRLRQAAGRRNALLLQALC